MTSSLSDGLLAQLVRALHRYCRGHPIQCLNVRIPYKPVFFFQAFFSQLQKLCRPITVIIFFLSILIHLTVSQHLAFNGPLSVFKCLSLNLSFHRKTIQNDMAIWEKSEQWPLSCYTYTKEEPCLPGKFDAIYCCSMSPLVLLTLSLPGVTSI